MCGPFLGRAECLEDLPKRQKETCKPECGTDGIRLCRSQKPWIGDDDRPVDAVDISRSVRLMWIAGSCVFAAGIGIRLLILLR